MLRAECRNGPGRRLEIDLLLGPDQLDNQIGNSFLRSWVNRANRR